MSDDRGLAATKRAVRLALRAARAARPPEQRIAEDHRRTEILRGRIDRLAPSAAAAYLSGPDEPATRDVIDHLVATGAEVWLPRLTGHVATGPEDPAWARFTGWEHLRSGPYAILEPDGPELPADLIGTAQLMLVPALAATTTGVRLGRGGGWYDRALARLGPATLTCALLYTGEVLPELPSGRYDRRVGAVCTPDGWIDCSPVRAPGVPAP